MEMPTVRWSVKSALFILECEASVHLHWIFLHKLNWETNCTMIYVTSDHLCSTFFFSTEALWFCYMLNNWYRLYSLGEFHFSNSFPAFISVSSFFRILECITWSQRCVAYWFNFFQSKRIYCFIGDCWSGLLSCCNLSL